MIKAGIIGGAGYTAGELIRLLISHPEAEIAWVCSNSHAGSRITDVHGGLYGDTDLRFAAAPDMAAIDVLFLCSAHGDSPATRRELTRGAWRPRRELVSWRQAGRECWLGSLRRHSVHFHLVCVTCIHLPGSAGIASAHGIALAG